MNTVLYLDDLENSQLNNEIMKSIHDIKFKTLILNDPCKEPNINIPMFNPEYISYATGEIIAFNIDNAYRIIKSVSSAKKTFYVWDLEWLRGMNNYFYNISVYQNINLVCRSDDHKKAIKNYCNVEPIVKSIDEYIRKRT